MSKDYKSIGDIALWEKEGKKSKFFSGKATFTYNGHQVSIDFVIFRNAWKKPGDKNPDYKGSVSDAYPSKVKEEKQEPKKDQRDIPF